MVISENYQWEDRLGQQGLIPVAGVDEAGRGPLAGPVVAGAVILPTDIDFSPFRDSKKMSAQARQRVFNLLTDHDIPYGVGLSSPAEIDRINILQASLLAMRRAVENLSAQPAALLIDGKFTIAMDLPQEALIKGEDKSASIAAASIVAKVSRDQLMTELAEQYPLYRFEQHKGYPTKLHKALISEHGPCPIHRRTFKGVREYLT